MFINNHYAGKFNNYYLNVGLFVIDDSSHLRGKQLGKASVGGLDGTGDCGKHLSANSRFASSRELIKVFL